MKMIYFLFLTILFQTYAFADLSSPRATMKTFLTSMSKVKNNEGDINQAYKKAISTLSLDHLDPQIRNDISKVIAIKLVNTIDRIEKVEYKNIPNSIEADKWVYKQKTVLVDGSQKDVEISMSKTTKEDGISEWKFSKTTIDNIGLFYQSVANNKIAKGVKRLETLSEKYRSYLPEWTQTGSFYLKTWQWITLILIFFIAWPIEKLINSIARFAINKNLPIIRNAPSDKLQNVIYPFGKLVFILLTMLGINLLDLNPSQYSVTKRLLLILMSINIVWLLHRIVQIASFYFTALAESTEAKFDDILVPLLTKTSFIVVYLFGIVLVAHNLTIDVTGLIAGLGIGGLAFAFAAKDTIANFFGSIMLVLDRPFDIGDVIVAGDVEGTVVEVGFRSTRIRTFYDSIITISNGELMNRSIDNKGKRRFRRLNATLGIEYSTTPEKVEAFCEGVRQIILSHNWTRKDNFHVYFVNYGASSLDIQLVVYWETSDYSREQAEKHRLMIDILRLSKELGIEFAFPTQTVHVFHENKRESENIDLQKYLDLGIEKGQNLANKPLSLKNPRSNAKDDEQFGKNDIGL